MCNNNVFRLLKASEVECRIARADKKKGRVYASYLIYKDARVDQRIMDETFGAFGWQATYETIDGKMFCKVSVWDSEKQCWISKMNVGSESNTEADKGLVSDCLKRACFTWGLGVELYSSPQIYVDLQDGEYDDKDGRIFPKLRLSVREIGYDENRKVNRLVLVDTKGNVRFSYGDKAEKKVEKKVEKKAEVYVSSDGKKKLTIGDKTWQKAVEKTANHCACEDGTPIPVWLADTYNLPDNVMKIFFEQVKSFAV